MNFIDVKSAEFVVSPELKSPMGSNAAAFANKQKLQQIMQKWQTS